MPQKQVKKTATKQEEKQVAETPEPVKNREELLSGIDELLDEIDEVLEQDAEEFVRSYIQKGGQ